MRRLTSAAVAVALLLSPSAARPYRLEHRLTDDAAARFGATLVGDGTRLAVAGPATAERPGIVAVWDGGDEPVLRLTSPDVDFGRGLALTPDALHVGSPGTPLDLGGAGVVARFSLPDGAPGPLLENPAGAPGGFGAALALVGGELAVGAPGLAGEAGAVHLYPPDATTPRTTLTAIVHPPRTDDLFGKVLVAAGDRLVVGAPGDDRGALDAGRVWVFEAATGALDFEIASPIPIFGGTFGSAIVALPDAIVVGAPGTPDGDLPGAGAVWLFDRDTGALRGRVTDPQPLARGRFGSALAVTDGLLAIGAAGSPFALPASGMVHLVDVAADARVQTLTHPDRPAAAAGMFGATLAGFGDDRLAVGAPSADLAVADEGAVYRFGTACPLCPPCHHCDGEAGACVPDAVCRPSAWLLGDSIFSGCGSTVAALAPDWDVENHGRALDLALQGREHLKLLLAQTEHLPNAAIAFLGTNDLSFGRALHLDPDDVAANAANEMATIRSLFDAAGVPSAIGLPLGWPRDLRTQVPDVEERREMEAGVRALRRTLHPLRPTVNLALGNPRLYADLIHPNDLGCEVIARRAMGALRRLVRRR